MKPTERLNLENDQLNEVIRIAESYTAKQLPLKNDDYNSAVSAK